MKSKSLNLITLFLFGGLTFALDYFSKIRVLDFISDRNFISYEVTKFFNIVLTYNKGISFGFLNSIEYGQWMFIALNCSIVFCLLIWLIYSVDIKATVLLSIIIGGAVGNIVDRILYGAVVDFLDFHYGMWHYPAFNLADSFVVTGVLGLLLFTSNTGKKRQA